MMTLDELAAEKAAGWPNIHPEDYCHRCAGKNLSWWIDSNVWNAVMGGPAGIVCPQCFAELFQERWPGASWELVLSEGSRGERAFVEGVNKEVDQ